ncbi:MAG: sugar phosphate nucleotidyltransferase [Candidatus Palauibacterales bacterium]|nr:sugar phosphate nucleotidyltransferase [Candidatus Palauibacterales bacterium]MDP2483255.1 sugar phosphate nucleotidyltransferase [Candidatus Palauibacterales bacterium]
MQAILPLAGKGTRLRPHTHTRPKPLLRVANRPVLDYVLRQLEEVGVDEIIGITGHLAPTIESWLSEEHPKLRFRAVPQEQQLGTADAIRLAEPYVEGPVLIVFVDTLFDADLGLIDARPDVDGIIWAKEVEDYQRFGVIVTDEDGHMLRIVEKPSEPISRLANIGLYYVRDWRLMFEGIAHVMASPPQFGEYFLTDAFQYMIDHGDRILTAEVDHWWDCGKIETLLETNRQVLLSGAAAAPAPADGVRIVPPVCVAPDVVLQDVEIGPNVSIGSGSTIRGARLRDCIVGENTVLEGCDLHDSLIGDHVTADGLSGAASVGDHSVFRVQD